jgi:hypothetical protein
MRTNDTTKLKVSNTFDREAIKWARDIVLPKDRILRSLNPRACRRGTVKSVLLGLAFRVAKTDDGRHVTWVGARRLAQDVGYDRVTVLAAIDSLEKLGLLKRESSKDHDTDNIYLSVGARLHNATFEGCTTQPPPGCINHLEEKQDASTTSEVEPIEGELLDVGPQESGGEKPGSKEQQQEEEILIEKYKSACATSHAARVAFWFELRRLYYPKLPNSAPDAKLHHNDYKRLNEVFGGDQTTKANAESVCRVLGYVVGHWSELAEGYPNLETIKVRLEEFVMVWVKSLKEAA